ncbi:MAG: hypothetical protein DMD49_09065 [Gemmatimonadetes bacterium]|nr:MAG: hypothetical protein DMD49_09065 [Gemmatimonadota bacterium]
MTLPPGSGPIVNGTKLWAEGGNLYVTELGNAGLYIWDAVSHDFVGFVGGMVGNVGAGGGTATTNGQGPSSIVLSGDGHAWVSDGNSTVRVVDLATRQVIASVNTSIAACDGGTATTHYCGRTNEITFDPEHRLVFVQNPSPLAVAAPHGAIDTYATFISADPPYAKVGTIAFADRRGQEAPVWDPDQHRILTAVSGRLAGTTVFPQYVAVIDPTVRPFTVEKHYDIDCFALGLAATPGAVFGINDPALGPDGKMVIPGCGRALITDVRTGAITILPVGGGNETWYNPGDGNFYVTGANFSITPAGPNSLGVIDARSSTIRQYVTALNATNPTAAAENNHIFAVVPANATTATACTQFGAAVQTSGCILVFAHVPGSD